MFDFIPSIGQWPRFGEPVWLKPLMVSAFLLVALMCGFYGWRSRFAATQPRTLQLFYWIQALLLVTLALNKQGGYLNSLTSFGRIIALREGWYSIRHSLQSDLILGIALVGCLLFGWGCWYFRAILRQQWLPLLGAIYLISYTAARAVSLHAVDAFLFTRVRGLQWDAILELGGLLLLFCSLIASSHRTQTLAHATGSEP